MKAGLLSLVVCVVCCVVGLAVSPLVALGDGSSSEGSSAGEGSGTSSSLEGPLVTPGSPVQGEDVKAAEEAKLANPDAVAEREASQTKFEGLNGEQAAHVDGEAFPAVIDEPAGGPPKLPSGESVSAYPADTVAQLALPWGQHGVLESMEPMAVQTGPGQRVPVDLSLSEAGGAFEPKTPFVPVRVPKSLGAGVSLGSTGVSLTPVDAQGNALAGSEGALDGVSVLYANTQTDADTVVKPTTAGFEADAMLRSVDSPEQLFFRVGLPKGASLVQTGDGSGPVEVIDEGATIATILPPGAHDAAGTAVPVSMNVSEDTLTLTVDHRAGLYLYPVEVDPEIRTTDDENLGGATLPTHWKFCTSLSSKCEHTESPFSSSGWGGTTLSDDAIAEYKTKQSAYFLYQAEGDSHIYEAHLTASAPDSGTNIETYLQLAGSGGVEETLQWGARNYGKVCAYSKGNNENCERVEAEKAPDEYGAAGNWLHFEQSAYGSGSSFTNTMEKTAVSIAQEGEPEYSFNTTSEKVDGRTNVFYGKGAWLGPHSGAFEIKFHDPGVGISMLEMQGDSWLVRHKFLEEGKCSGVFCAQTHEEMVTYNPDLLNGEDIIEAGAKDSVGKEAVPVGPFYETVKVDATPPHNLTLAGLPSTGVIDEGELHLQGKATDGTAPTPSSGIKALRLGLDGYTIPGGRSGSCTPGPCAASGEWTLDGEGIGAGKHTLELVAEDNAENIEIAKYTITVRHAGALSVGPGSVNPLTGALHLNANDVSLSGGRGSLGVSRSYNSRQLTNGELGPLGPPWKLSVSGSQEIEQEPTGSVVLISSSGGRTTFESNGKGGFVAPKGDENLVLEAQMEGEKVEAYLLKDPTAGTTVKYAQAGGAGPWVIASSEGALSKTNGEKETVEWERLEGVTRPKLAIAPAPEDVTCSPTVKEPKELAVGCRALSFTYATETTATGEAPSEWKAYKGRLMQVSFTAYNPATKAMETKPVAEYTYDKQGHLRAEWDPRITPSPLKTTYGYDSEGHVVAVNPPGQEPWLIHYGTTSSDASAGRLLSVTRPPAGTSAQVKEQDEKAAPVNTAVPTLSSTSPAIGTTLSIASNGTWSNSPSTYSDAWEDCYTYESKETCTTIPGAVNNTYTPQPRDAGYTLRAQVTAVNADGASVATTTASKALAGVAPVYLRKFGEKGTSEKGQFNAPVATAIDSAGNVWGVDHNNDRVEEWSSTGTWLHTYGSKGTGSLQFESPEGIAINTNPASPSYGDVYIADKGNNRIEELSSEGKFVRVFGTKGKEPGQLSSPEGIAVVPTGATTSATSGEVWVGDSGNNRIDEFSEAGEYIGSFGVEGSGEGQFKGPDGIAFSGEDAYVVDSGNDRVQEFSMSGQFLAKFGAKGTGNGQFEAPYGIATEPVSGDLYVADSGNNRLQEFSPTGAFLVAYGKKGEGSGEFSGPDGVAASPAGDVYVTDTGNNRVQELEPKYSTNNPLPEPPALGTSSVATIDYNVPVSGSGAPHEMTATELEKWGQKDDPTAATAIFPPDEPMGWPAKDYKRASISYYDELGRTVNHAAPSGGIATSEYNETNEMIRSLSADNREAALKEGAKSKEVSELLDTKSRYNGETKEEKEAEEKANKVEPGARLLETWGPQHTIKRESFSEAKARNHIHYYYDEGAPGGETFNLVTKTTDGAEYEGEEDGKRTTITSYSGQGDLGWLLRKPTSVTIAATTGSFPSLNITHTTVYNWMTGDVVETRAPASESGGHIGSPGSGDGQVEPNGVAVAPNGNVYVANSTSVEEFTPAGAYVTKWSKGEFLPTGIAVAPNGDVYVIDQHDRVLEFSATGTYIAEWGSEGTGNGEFEHPRGIAIDPDGNVYVADTNNDRVQEFSSTGEFLAKWGSEGTGSGQFKSPYGVAVAVNGDILISDYGNDRIQEFSATGAFITKWGSEGDGNGQLRNPYGVAVAANGDVIVGEYGGNRIDEFSESGSYITSRSSKGPGNGQVQSPAGVAVSPTGTIYVADANHRIDEFAAFPAAAAPFGGMAGQFKEPAGVAAAPSGYVYYAVDTGNSRIQEFSISGEHLNSWGAAGSENGQFKVPDAAAVAPDGNVYVADTGNKRIQEFTPTGEYVTKWSVEGVSPEGIAVATNGNVYVADTASDRIEEFTATGTYVTKWGSVGSENGKFQSPQGIAVAANGNVYVADASNNRIQEFTSTGTYVTKWGGAGGENGQFKDPQGIGVTAAGAVYVADTGNERVQEFSASGEYVTKWGAEGGATGQFKTPEDLAVAPGGNVYVADTGNNRIQEFTSSGTYLAQTGSGGAANGQLKEATSTAVAPNGNVYVADTGSDRIEEYSSSGAYMTQWGSAGSESGEFDSPQGIAISPSGNVYVADTENRRIQEFSASGAYITKWGSLGAENGQFKSPEGIAVAANGDVYVADTDNDRIQEFSSSGTYITKWGAYGSGNGQFIIPASVAVAANGDVYVADTHNNRIQEFSSSGAYIAKWGSEGTANGQFKSPAGVTVAPNGTVYVSDTGNNRIQAFYSSGEYWTTFGGLGTGYGGLSAPRGIVINTSKDLYVADAGNNRVQEWSWTPNENAHDIQTSYYTAGEEAATSACDNHPEWAELPCQSEPAVQPEGSLPKLPVANDSYNMWDEPETVTEEFGSATRTKKLTYDAAGRALTSEETTTGSSDTAVPRVTDEYSSETGAMTKQSTTVGETTKSIKSVYDTLGRLTEYTDADGNTTQYVYSGPANDGRVEEVNYGGKKGSQIYSYNSTSMALDRLLDVGPEGGAGAGTFTASYDVEGNMTSETYPNGMTVKYTINSTGEATGIEYEKTVHCASTCPETWFKETVVPSIHGEILVRTSTLATEEYSYDEAGRLTEVKETPVGGGCTRRAYTYDNESDRSQLETAAPEAGGECGGFDTGETHIYDEADRLADTGVEYEVFGNETKIPAADAGEHEITASFYADNQIAVQTQNGETTNYSYDPAGRTEKTISEGTTKSTIVNHYPGPGEAISWACEEAAKECEEGKGAKWTRDIPGIDGSLAATQHDSEAAILQLYDLEGDVVATAAVSETETKLLTTYNPTEFGVPVNGTPPTRYSWLGASGLATETSSGAANPGGGSYVAQLGLALQTEPITPPGAYANGSYNGAVFTPSPSAEALAQSDSYGAGAPVREAERQKAQQEEAEKHAYENECHIGSCEYHGPENPESGEGGAEEETTEADPEWRFTESEAREVAAVFLGVGNGAEAVIVERLQKYLGVLGAELAAQLGTSAITSVGNQLNDCATTISYMGDDTEDARCKLDLKFKLGFSQWLRFEVDLCFTGEDRKKHPANYPYCTEE